MPPSTVTSVSPAAALGRRLGRRHVTRAPRCAPARRAARSARAGRARSPARSAVRSSPPSTTTRPSTSSVCTRGAAPEDERGDGVVDAGVPDVVDAPERDVGALADLERADLVAAAEAARAVDGAERERLARRQRRRAVRAGARTAAPGAARRRARRPRSRRRRRRRGRRARRRARRSATGAMPVPRRPFELGQCATPVRVSPKRATSRGVDVDAVREPHVVAEPAEPLEVLDRPAAEALLAEPLLVDRLGEVRVQAHAARARERGRLAHQRLGDRERRAGRDRDPRHRARRRVVVAVDRLRRGLEDRVAILDDLVRREPALRARRDPSSRGRGGSARRGRAPRRPRPRAGRRRRAGRGSGGRSSSSSPRGAAPRGRRVAAAACTSPSTSAQRGYSATSQSKRSSSCA